MDWIAIIAIMCSTESELIIRGNCVDVMNKCVETLAETTQAKERGVGKFELAMFFLREREAREEICFSSEQ
jgi:hypothetical protein